jgi:CRP-like cAMP-binding protein
MVQAEVAQRFMSAPLLADVDPGSRRAVLEALVEENATSGSVLLEQGQPNDHLTFLIKGTVRVERKKADGRVDPIVTLSAPSVFGTTSFFGPNAPTFTVRATTEVLLLTLHHRAHDRLRLDNPKAAEALAVAAVRVLADRFDELDRLFTKYMADHPHDQPKVSEWAGFRARLFEEAAD